MLSTIDDLDGALQCPRTGEPLLSSEGRVTLRNGNNEALDYPVAGNTPVLIDFQNSVIKREDVELTKAASVIERPRYSFVSKFIKSLLSPEKETTRRNVDALISELKNAIAVTAFDIYNTGRVQVVADAHDIPIVDGHFDGVVI
ncbi:MAG: hypothetical protein WA957_14055, partial [Alteraurantiacibacter sp.]